MRPSSFIAAAVATVSVAACTALDPDPGPSAGKTCSVGRVIAGNPVSSAVDDPAAWTPAGHPARAEPPMHFSNVARRGDTLVVSTGRSIWRIDLAAAAPAFVRVAGDDVEAAVYRPSGPCADVRFLASEGLAWLPDGRLVVGDDWANGVVELSDPLSASCTAKVIAGNATVLTNHTPATVYQPGDVTGPGAGARFAAPDDAIAGDSGEVYVWDRGNRQIKRIADDAARTVSSVFTLDGELDNVNALAYAHGRLYAGGFNIDGTRVIAIDVATGEVTPIAHDADIPGPGSSLPVAIAGDGDALVVYASGGFIYRIGADGAITHVAGHGERNSDLTDDAYAGELPAMDAPLNFVDGFVGGGNVVVSEGHLLIPSHDDAWGLWDFTCE